MSNENNQDSSSLEQSDEPTINEMPEMSPRSEEKRFGTTVSVGDSIARIRQKLDKDQAAKPSITLNIDGTEAPITFTNRREIIIGRTDPNSEQRPDIDVSGLPINYSSISRKHIRLVYTKSAWFVEDMGSRNGSWLNGKLLLAHQRYQVRNQDHIQVGTVNVVVTFRDEQAPAPPRQTSLASQRFTGKLMLQIPDLKPQQAGLSPDYIANNLLPYLSMIITMMKTLDRAKKRSLREISIKSFVLQQPMLIVEFSIGHEVVQFLSQHHLFQAMSDNLDDTTEILSLPSGIDNNDTLEDSLQTFVQDQLPLVPEAQQEQFKQQFRESIEFLLNHNFRIVN